MTSEIFKRIGNRYIKQSAKVSKKIGLRRFKSFFGTTPNICSKIWNLLADDIPEGSSQKHLLWCLSFLKQYTGESCRRALFKADEKTIRKWTWKYVKLLSNLNVIDWERRFEEAVPGQSCFVSLDGIDFKIKEPIPFSHKWYSHKFHGPGLRYEIGLCVRTGNIVWKNGGYPCGDFPDLKLAREAYVLMVEPWELTLADKGYNDPKFFIIPTPHNGSYHKYIMSRHETVNKRVRQFYIMKHTFRSAPEKHPLVFNAVLNVTQIVIENEEPLFSVV